ncbi:MAG TPA: glutamate synthase (NADPH), homotetrameric [Hungateiclostridium thermocellum]|uniref:Glutamate synthase (NADPH), homotetrameric n=1 Tax=Acetivibrio thermocellus (strain ATCC 27405 / DSM 1237 / JCM 9322 / NBRC 103400 / NCIMB 10682 / NRRL B-4536 / VPI 7372) TaxID=203119 RepID=A3DCD1_ACET2|nr:NADPH-dependent glutamate synthase [Acetivibrio thermocellus]CDG35048.1 sulfide dehydrogenase (flavoprotein) subunit SudA [Acetivibrio thermocellus BC1]ABN51610.1 glutamate synthase (NADPH), homotetrameric [Acetivibrio thermocellus ATCC 27405]THJ77393.1 NADPH-dependent glutamate synthase [Acetivibrio thermocellus]UWV45862.1 NADPH-dependent glutamate synthase [Acetivibrio thermocellus]HBW25900.1 glutamate synthase (NADPH), homotetrameric [Acetivibrio thermocellus]
MPNMSPKKVPMPEQDPNVRIKNFLEVALGYTEQMAMEEAQRCLNCKHKPCVSGCPVNVKIPEFVQLIAQGKFEEAYNKIRETNNLPAICGRVCPQENQCEKFCVRGIKGEPVAIGRLERFAADWHMKNGTTSYEKPEKNGKRVAVIGSGPASLTCASDLAKLGYEVTIFEAFHVPGGVLMYGIPEFRLPKKLVQEEIETIKQLGVEIKTNMVIGKVYSIDELKAEGYDAIFIGSGAGLPSFMKIPGENLNGVYSANEFLTRINLMKAYEFPNCDTPVKVGKNVAVVGGGNVAMDAARSAKRLGAENVYIVYRRSEAEMPARLEEIHHAKEEGILFKFLTNPTRILGTDDGWVKGMECIEMELGEPDESGRRRPVPKPGSEHVIDVETVIIAIGQTPNPLIASTTPGLATQKWGGIIVDENTGATNIEGVYAGGDAVTGAATVILAMGAGKKAAKAIDEYLKNKK